MLMQSCLTVLFEEPFWVGLYERRCNGCYEICKITFGTEPKESEIYNFLLENWPRLHFAQTQESNAVISKLQNPKRMQREISKQLQAKSISTKAQQALQQNASKIKLFVKPSTAKLRKLNRNAGLCCAKPRKKPSIGVNNSPHI